MDLCLEVFLKVLISIYCGIFNNINPNLPKASPFEIELSQFMRFFRMLKVEISFTEIFQYKLNLITTKPRRDEI